MGLNPPLVAPNAIPPIAVTATPIPKVSAATRLTLMPTSAAAVRFCMVARTARPNRVRYSTAYSTASAATASPKASRSITGR